MNKRAPLATALILSVSVSLAACDSTSGRSSTVLQIVSITSFGMCMGYCKTRLEITESQAVLIREPGGRGALNLPVQRFAKPLAPGEWQQLSAAAAAARFEGLPDTIGCPDCADGGAESLSVIGKGEEKKVTFEYGADVPGLLPLLVQVRDLRTSLAPKE